MELTYIMQKKELEMLKKLADILVKNNIRFCLACGTALGCVRHEGFIPWDDDIDIYILGEDYPKLKNIFLNENTGELQLHDYESIKNYPYIFPKVISNKTILKEKELEKLDYVGGVYIDIFPLQSVSDFLIVRFFQEIKRYICYCLLRAYYYEPNSACRKLLSRFIKKYLQPEKIQKSIYKKMIASKKSRYVVEPLLFFKSTIIKRNYVVSTYLRKFENTLMPVPIDVKDYLKDYYGNYMKIPSEDERKSNHAFSCLIIDGVKYV